MESVAEPASNEALISAIMFEVDESYADIEKVPGFQPYSYSYLSGPGYHTKVKVIHLALTVLKNNKVQTFEIEVSTISGKVEEIQNCTRTALTKWINSDLIPDQSLLKCTITVELSSRLSLSSLVTYPLCSYEV